MAQPLALVWDLIARDGASATFGRVAASADKAAVATNRAAGATAGFSKKAAAALGALATIDFGVHAVKDAAKFQASMTRIQTVVGASKAEVNSMSKSLMGLSGQVGTGPEELAVSLYHMEAIGLRGAEALDAVKVAAQGAKIGNADLEETTNALTATIQSGIAKGQGFSATMAQLLTIVGTGDMKLQDFNESLGTGLLATVANAGLSLRDVGAALAVFGDNNIRGANAATMLRVAVQALQQPAKGGEKALAAIGIKAGQLRDDLMKGGLNAALTDLKQHLDESGNSGKKSGALIVEAFGKRANTGIGVLIRTFDLLQTKYGIIDKNTRNFGPRWAATIKTAQFAFDKLRAELETVTIAVGQKLIPAATKAFNFLSGDVGPALVGPWHALEEVLSVVASALSIVGTALGALHIPLGGLVVAVLGAVAAFKLMNALFLRGGIIDAIALRMMYAKDSVVRFGNSAKAMATTFAGSSAAVAASAEASAGAVAASGEAAAVGWRGILGPLAAAAIGVGLLVSIFHRSSGASKQAAAALKAYTDALSGGEGKTSIVDTITKQLADNNVPQKIADLNTALGGTAYTGKQFVNAIQNGGPALDRLRGRLEAVVRAGTQTSVSMSKAGGSVSGTMTPAAKAASKLLADLNVQFGQLTAAAKKDLLDTKAFAGVSSSINKVTAATKVGTDTAKQYATMMGIVVDKNGIAAVSAATLDKAIETVSTAFDNATQTGSDYLKAVQAFSTSAGTAADRAALIGATLKAANGDALGFASAMTGTTQAVDSLVSAFHDQSEQLRQQNADQQKAAQGITSAHRSVSAAQERVIAAQERLNEVRANSKSTDAQVKSAQASLTAAQNAAASAADRLANAQGKAGKAGALAYADTERAAIHFKQTATGLLATIDTSAKGAGDLVSQLQGMQTAAMAAASAMFQHERATQGAKQAADDAYNIYVSKTRGSLIDQASQLGLTKRQAKALADEYFGIKNSGDIKKTIEAEGTQPVLDVLNKIGRLLANLTGQQWDIKIGVGLNNDVGKAVHDAVNNIPKAALPKPGAVVPHARGGLMSPGWNLLGEYGPEFYNRASGQVLTAPKTAARRGMGGNNVTINQTINNATPEPASVSGPASVRKAAKSIERAI